MTAKRHSFYAKPKRKELFDLFLFIVHVMKIFRIINRHQIVVWFVYVCVKMGMHVFTLCNKVKERKCPTNSLDYIGLVAMF